MSVQRNPESWAERERLMQKNRDAVATLPDYCIGQWVVIQHGVLCGYGPEREDAYDMAKRSPIFNPDMDQFDIRISRLPAKKG